jgi:hypothetical protein
MEDIHKTSIYAPDGQFPGLLTRLRAVLTAAQINTLHSAPVTVIPAPGAGKVLVLDSLSIQTLPGTVNFTSGGAITAVYHGGSTALHASSLPNTVVQSGTGSITNLGPLGASNGLTLSVNTGVDIVAASADFASGNGALVINLWYSVITLG